MWSVRVGGEPVPKPDPKCFGRGGMHRLSIDKNHKGYAAWRPRCLAAGQALHRAIGGTLDGPVSIEITATLPRPKSAPKHRIWPAVRNGDADKIARLILDALTDAQVWHDDSQAVDLRTVKAYPNSPTPDALPAPGAIIRIWRTPNEII